MLVVLVLAGVAVFFVISAKKNNQAALDPYKEPTPTFFDASQVSGSDIVVKITDQGFDPATVTIKKGQKITWVNLSNRDAWPASDPHPTHTNYPEFDTQLPLKSNLAWSFVFDRVGDWGYHNHLMPGMRGTVHVTE